MHMIILEPKGVVKRSIECEIMKKTFWLIAFIAILKGASSDGQDSGNQRRYQLPRSYQSYIQQRFLRIPVQQQILRPYRFFRLFPITPKICSVKFASISGGYSSIATRSICYSPRPQAEVNNIYRGLLYCYNNLAQGKCDDRECDDDDKCPPKDCKIAQCEKGYCGDNCVPSTRTTGKTCNNDPDCLTDGATCIEGQCRCDCNETFSGNFTLALFRQFLPPIERSKCLKECRDGLSSEFTNATAGFSSDVEKLVERDMPLAECQQLCLDEKDFVCRSVSLIATEGGGCGLSRTRQSETPIDIVKEADVGFKYSERKCK